MKSFSHTRTLAVGVAGGIGSGKTEACKEFESLGIRILSADHIARDIIDSDPGVKKKIVKLFDEQVYVDGHLDRKYVARKIFGDDRLQHKLNAIVHPVVIQHIDNIVEEAKRESTEAIIMIEAALLFESGADGMLDYVILIDADEEHRIERVMKRDTITRQAVLERIRSQMPVRDARQRADFIIHNNGNLSKLKEQAQFLFRLLMSIARGPISN